MRDKKAIAFCTPSDLKELREAKLIHKFVDKKGIPQELPISAVLANIYMLVFDKAVNAEVKKANALYRRYSDDIIIASPGVSIETLKKIVENSITDVRLDI